MRSHFRTLSNRRQARQVRSRFGRRSMMVAGVWLRLLRHRQYTTAMPRRAERMTAHMRHVLQSRIVVSSTTVRERSTITVEGGGRWFDPRLMGPAARAVTGSRHRSAAQRSSSFLGDHGRPTRLVGTATPAVRRFEWTRSGDPTVLRPRAQQPPMARSFGRGRNDAQFSFGLSGADRKVVLSSSSRERASVAVEAATGAVPVEGSNRARPSTAATESPDIERLTDRVVDALDRRLWAQRERMGGR